VYRSRGAFSLLKKVRVTLEDLENLILRYDQCKKAGALTSSVEESCIGAYCPRDATAILEPKHQHPGHQARKLFASPRVWFNYTHLASLNRRIVSKTVVYETNYSLNSRVNPNTFHI
jgi:hypothetical protein